MRLLRRLAFSLVLASLALTLNSCALIAWIVAVINPPQKVEAKFEPPAEKKMLVFVDLTQVDTPQPLRGALTEAINEQLLENEVAESVVPYEDLLDLSATMDGFDRATPARIGRELEAEYVCHVLVHRFTVKEDEVGPLWEGHLDVSVSMVDVEEGEIAWPKGEDGGWRLRPIKTPLTDDPSPDFGPKLTGDLANRMADRIAKLFYDHRAVVEPELPD